MKEIRHDDMKKRWTSLSEDDWNEIDVKAQIIGAILSGRKEQGLTQKELGESCGLARNIIARLENNKTDPHLTTVLRALRPLGKTLAVVPIPDGCEKGKTADHSSARETEFATASCDEADETEKWYSILTEYDEEKLKREIARESWEIGFAKGLTGTYEKIIAELMTDASPEEIADRCIRKIAEKLAICIAEKRIKNPPEYPEAYNMSGYHNGFVSEVHKLLAVYVKDGFLTTKQIDQKANSAVKDLEARVKEIEKQLNKAAGNTKKWVSP